MSEGNLVHYDGWSQKTYVSKLHDHYDVLIHYDCGYRQDSEDVAADRNRAMASALATFLRQVGHTSTKSNASLERCPSFLNKDKKMFKFKTNKKVTNPHIYTFCKDMQLSSVPSTDHVHPILAEIWITYFWWKNVALTYDCHIQTTVKLHVMRPHNYFYVFIQFVV